MVEYGLLVSSISGVLSGIFGQLTMLWASVPLWQIIGGGVVLFVILHWLFKSR